MPDLNEEVNNSSKEKLKSLALFWLKEQFDGTSLAQDLAFPFLTIFGVAFWNMSCKARGFLSILRYSPREGELAAVPKKS